MRRVLGAAAAVLLAVACGGGDDGDIDLFCERIDALIDDDPFARLPDEATPTDLRHAFEQLRDGTEAVAAAAPDELRALARQYANTTAQLDDLLAGAGYRGDEVDSLEYRQRAREQSQAASRLEVAAGRDCPGGAGD